MLFVKMQLNVVVSYKHEGILSHMCPLPHPLAWSLEILFYKRKRKACRDSEPIPSDIIAVSIHLLHRICETVWQRGNPTGFVNRGLELCPWLIRELSADSSASLNSFYKKVIVTMWLKSQGL